MFPALLAALLTGTEAPPADRPFGVRVVDQETGRGVPLIELRTVHGVGFVTDSAGWAAVAEPELMGQDVFFHVAGHGYDFPADGFGYRGKALRVTPGGRATLSVRRINLAERLYRVTGGGIYRDSVLLGEKTSLREPLLNAQVLGSDSVLNAVYRGKLYWFWGDTLRPGHPLGNYHTPGATSELPGRGGLDPERGVDLTYFTDERGFARELLHMPGKGPTWMTAVTPLPDRTGRERLYASYVKVEPPLTVRGRGLAVFDDDRGVFTHLADVPLDAPAFPSGHAFRRVEDGTEYVYFANPFPVLRVKATAEAFADPKEWEAFTCLQEGTRPGEAKLDRPARDRLRYAWRKNAAPVGPKDEVALLAAGAILPEEVRWQLRDRDTGKRVPPHSGSVAWNAYRRRWALLAVEVGGTSELGEVWYAEADTPLGPWAYAVKVATHDRYSFYNPKLHPEFDTEGGRVVFFEGTYTHTFSGNPVPTPRYEYNQGMYRLDLSGPRLTLPAAVYALSAGPAPEAFGFGPPKEREARPAFFAPDRPGVGTVPVLGGEGGLALGKPGAAAALFHALPPDTPSPPAGTAPLYEYRHRDGKRRAYSVQPALALEGFERAERPLCRVWPTHGAFGGGS